MSITVGVAMDGRNGERLRAHAARSVVGRARDIVAADTQSQDRRVQARRA